MFIVHSTLRASNDNIHKRWQTLIMWNFTIKLDDRYQNLKGNDYYFDLVFNRDKFKGIDTFTPLIGDWNILKRDEITYFNSQSINFSIKVTASSYRFQFNNNVTSVSALKIMQEIIGNFVMNNHQKCALYIVESESEIRQFIY